MKVLEKRFGRIEYETIEIPCTIAGFYKEEMGEPLFRRFFCFEKPVPRDFLVEAKKICHKIEPMFADHVDDFIFRTVNIDPGIMTPDNIVMASHREYNHRLYLKDGVYAEIALIYARDHFARLPWTCADFYHDEAIDFFMRVRHSFELIERPSEISSP